MTPRCVNSATTREDRLFELTTLSLGPCVLLGGEMSWSEPSEDLEFNLYYQAIQVCPCVSQDRHLILSPSTSLSLSLSLSQTRYVQQYDHAQQNCWLVCIPRAVSLTGCSITRSFVGE